EPSHRGIGRDLRGHGILGRRGARRRDRRLQFRQAQFSRGPSRPRHARHVLLQSQAGRLAPSAAHAHVAGADQNDARQATAHPRHHSGADVPQRQRPDPYADVPSGRRPGRRQELAPRPFEMDPAGILQGLLRSQPGQDAFSPVVLSLHRAIARGRHPVPARQGRDPLRRGRGLDGDPRLRHGASERAAQLRTRSGHVPRFRLGYGDRSHRHAQIRHAGPARILRGRRALARSLRLSTARFSHPRGRIVRMMKFTLAWLKEHLDTDAPLAAIVDKLTTIGLEVENVADRGKMLASFSIARVISAEQHPNADRLRVCMVDTGTGAPVQVVCGAPNARAGMKGVFVPPGAFIPGKNMTLGIGKIRGVESRGMLVSELELQISDDHEGIIDLPDDAPVGASYAQWAGLDDPVIEINLTPNRPDCAGVNGIARDLAAAEMGKFKDRPIEPVRCRFPCPTKITLDFGATPPLCPAFALRLVRGVKNGSSPEWLARRLTTIGLRPINALVDITNFITYDRGRPLHVFDAAKVKGDLVVRRAKGGETLLALDGKCYDLDDTMCVIADKQGVESLAGIMGGEATGCSRETTDVLIESALWDATNIAQTGRKLGINSDA